MLWLFRKVVDRLKALLVADAALDLEAEFLARHADRKAELLRKADEYAEQGLADVAEELRAQAAQTDIEGYRDAALALADHYEQAAAARLASA
jgi:hypothetical protein